VAKVEPFACRHALVVTLAEIRREAAAVERAVAGDFDRWTVCAACVDRYAPERLFVM